MESWLLALPLVTISAGGFAMQPVLWVSITEDAIGLDNLAMLSSWRTPHLARALSANPGVVVPIDNHSVVALNHGELAPDARGGPTGRTLPALDDLLHRVRQMDDLRRAYAHTPPWSNVNVFVAPDVPWRTVHPVLQTLAAEGFDQYNLVARRGTALVVHAFNVPDSEPAAPTPLLPLSVRVRPSGWQVAMGAASVGADCRALGPAHTVPRVAGHLDTDALTACMVVLRRDSVWHERLTLQRHIAIELDGALSFREVHAVLSAVEDATPGSRDLFTNPTLGMLP